MASRRGGTKGKRNSVDPSNPVNWTNSQLKDALKDLGINISIPLSNSSLRRLYLDNVNKQSETSESSAELQSPDNPAVNNPTNTNEIMDLDNDRQVINATSNTESVTDRNSTVGTLNNVVNPTNTRMNMPVSISGITHPHCAGSAQMESMLMQTIQLCQQTLQQVNRQSVLANDFAPKFNLQSAMSASPLPQPHPLSANNTPVFQNFDPISSTPVPIYSTKSFGVPATSISDTDMISPEVRQQIITGKDVNLNILLIPNYDTPVNKKTQDKDERLRRNLSLDEFIIAFGRFKRIMCSAFPSRTEELDLYLAHIVETANIWPHKFFEYHKMFSAKCATMLLQHNIKIDWSKGDIELRQKICAGSRVNSCLRCHSTLHSTAMCQHKISHQNNFTSKGSDSLGRDVSYHEGQQVCNNFNWSRGCSKPYCKYLHICKSCKSKSHGKFTCMSNKVSETSKQSQLSEKPTVVRKQ